MYDIASEIQRLTSKIARRKRRVCVFSLMSLEHCRGDRHFCVCIVFTTCFISVPDYPHTIGPGLDRYSLISILTDHSQKMITSNIFVILEGS